MPTILDAMTPFPHSIEGTEHLRTAVALMYAKEIRHLPVTTAGQLTGLLTDRDAKLAMAITKNKREQDAMLVEEVCIVDPYVVPHTEKLDVVVRSMGEKHIGSALITREGKLVGIFTATDAIYRLAELLKAHYPDA
jgi:CBS domain-containing protein